MDPSEYYKKVCYIILNVIFGINFDYLETIFKIFTNVNIFKNNYTGTSSHSKSLSSPKDFFWTNYDFPETDFTISVSVIIFMK